LIPTFSPQGDGNVEMFVTVNVATNC